ncbi:Chorismate mutase [Methanocella conradii HZ254]|uniref:Chorismate mutase n=1 Tax=Methanocella conradii (strain DSM 24694 / JCM 17849 / CGMCC 1.5162 / HZ254) TaxID=1041930 RepID=H8IA36_METCZ|nr:chorismate mutase [Methanocella conradii]AFC99102.1 Chorismate mutase [Methanocella conradii HZ254]MDI6896653.1 chorismate mutase [Methanocella conradii]
MSIEEIRDEVRKVDLEILRLLARRMDLVGLILEEKKRQGLAINDDRQNELVLKRAMEKALELNLDVAAVKDIFQAIIDMSISRQHELSGEGKLP